MQSEIFDKAWTEWEPDLVALLRELQTEIGDDYRASNDPGDDTPAMAITISCDADCTQWSYQTGDNSYSGGCYGHPYWGVGSLTRDSDPEAVARELVDDLANQVEFD